MAVLTKEQRKAVAKRYWAIKSPGTVVELAMEFGVSIPTVRACAAEYAPKEDSRDKRRA